MADLLLIRGLPGSGKSTLARKIVAAAGFHHYEADMFFMLRGEYHFDGERLKESHEWCQRMTRRALANGFNVVVSNTFSRLWEMRPYLEMPARITVIRCEGDYGNVHGVPAEVVERMAARFENFSNETIYA